MKKSIPRKPGKQYTVLIRCKECNRGRWIMPQDAFHVKRCKTHQYELVKHRKKIAMRKLRAARKAKKLARIKARRAA